MIAYQTLNYFCTVKVLPVVALLISGQLGGNDDPGLPGGDPDLPNAPLDSGIYLMFAILLFYGMYKIRTRKV